MCIATDFETGSCYMAQAVIHSPPASASLCWNYTTMHSLFNVHVHMCVCIMDILYMYFLVLLYFLVLGMEPRAQCMPGKCDMLSCAPGPWCLFET